MINTHDQAHTYNKRLEQSKQLSFTNINSLNNVAPFYSIKLQAFNRVLEMQISSINKARVVCITLFHINKYPRALQNRLMNIYQLQWRTVKPVLDELIEKGYISAIPTRRKTNVKGLVTLISYGITPAGRSMVKMLGDLLDAKLASVKP